MMVGQETEMKTLDKKQKKFINKKVKKLGSMAAVKTLYNKDCEVDHYAIKMSRKLYPRKIKRRLGDATKRND